MYVYTAAKDQPRLKKKKAAEVLQRKKKKGNGRSHGFRGPAHVESSADWVRPSRADNNNVA